MLPVANGPVWPPKAGPLLTSGQLVGELGLGLGLGAGRRLLGAALGAQLVAGRGRARAGRVVVAHAADLLAVVGALVVVARDLAADQVAVPVAVVAVALAAHRAEPGGAADLHRDHGRNSLRQQRQRHARAQHHRRPAHLAPLCLHLGSPLARSPTLVTGFTWMRALACCSKTLGARTALARHALGLASGARQSFK